MSPLVMVDDSAGVKDALTELLDAAGVAMTNHASAVQSAVPHDLAVLRSTVPASELAAAMRRATLGLRRVAALDTGAEPSQVAARLSPRELEVLELVAAGHTADGVAAELFLSVETVRTHTRNAVRKLGARNRLHAVVMALAAGAIAVPDADAAPAV
jgi:DNA-binding NarL/FixJ family response regulator